MNPFFHRAYDSYLFAITPDYEIVISEQLITNTNKEEFKKYLAKINGNRITLPEKFYPNRNLLSNHYEQYRKRE